MVDLQMRYFPMAGVRVPGTTEWRIGLPGGDFQDVQFPSDARILELWKVHVPSEFGLVFKDPAEGMREPINYILVGLPTGTKKKHREAFLQSLIAECTYA